MCTVFRLYQEFEPWSHWISSFLYCGTRVHCTSRPSSSTVLYYDGLKGPRDSPIFIQTGLWNPSTLHLPSLGNLVAVHCTCCPCTLHCPLEWLVWLFKIDSKNIVLLRGNKALYDTIKMLGPNQCFMSFNLQCVQISDSVLCGACPPCFAKK